MARRTSFSSGFAALDIVSGLGILQCVWDQNSADETHLFECRGRGVLGGDAGDGLDFDPIERQATRDEAQPADVILVLGAAEYRGRPSPVLKARLDHALDLYRKHLAPRIMTTGGAGGDPVFTEGDVGATI